MADALAGVVATLIALAFSLSTFERFLAGRRRHELAWSVALALFAIASAALALGASDGWSGATYRVFFLFGGVVNVPVARTGTLTTPPKRKNTRYVAPDQPSLAPRASAAEAIANSARATDQASSWRRRPARNLSNVESEKASAMSVATTPANASAIAGSLCTGHNPAH